MDDGVNDRCEETLASRIGMAILGSPPQLGQPWEEQIGNAILAMPEMQAIRQLLAAEAQANVRGYVSRADVKRQMIGWLERRQMPPAVVAWVMEEA